MFEPRGVASVYLRLGDLLTIVMPRLNLAGETLLLLLLLLLVVLLFETGERIVRWLLSA